LPRPLALRASPTHHPRMNERSRRFVGGLIRAVLVVLALWIVAFWIYRRLPDRGHVRLQTQAPSPEQLGPGDLRIYNVDSSVDVILQGDHILAGLSAKTVAQIKTQMDSERTTDSGLGGSIAQIVKKTVAENIGTHAVFPLSDVRDVRFDNGHLVFVWNSGADHKIFQSVKANGKQEENSFRPGDAQAFIDAVRARKKELAQ